MSNFYTLAIRPKAVGRKPKTPKKLMKLEVEMLDDYYGPHRYGVRFPDGKVYPEEMFYVEKP